jgi:hypothetical protein
MLREGYYDYMLRRLRETREENPTMLPEDIWMKEISQMQAQVHLLQIRIVELCQQVYDLNYKITSLGGDSKQLELKFDANL